MPKTKEEIEKENNIQNDKCPNCEVKMSWSKQDIGIGDKKGTYRTISFEYCDECGHTGYVDWYD